MIKVDFLIAVFSVFIISKECRTMEEASMKEQLVDVSSVIISFS